MTGPETSSEPFDWGPIVESAGTAPIFETAHGALWNEDCLDFLASVRDESVDLVFADPPFNLGKVYGPHVSDKLDEGEYVAWGRSWIEDCVRTLKPGGSFFLFNLPKWNILFGSHMMRLGLQFRHWIAVSIKFGLPIPGRLYPAHYSLLYYTKGKPSAFNRIRTPIETCRHCGGDIKDYGGHRGAMNPNGVNLTDVWADIPPVRHWKFKSRKRAANQLSTKLLTRVVNLASVSGDVVLDPFGGSGTTFDVCEQLGRRWIGTELGDCSVIMERMNGDRVSPHATSDWVEREAA